MQNQFVGGMADKWACRNAQSFFNDAFKPSVDSLISSSNQIFESIVSAMNAAGQAWAEQTDANYSPVSFSAINKTMDTSVIQENIGGVRGIDLDTATGDEIAAGDKKTAVVRIEYDKNVSSDQLPTTGETLALTFSMNFVQA